MKQSIIVYGPQACGKTVNAERLKNYFGLKKISDGEGFPLFNTLIITNSFERSKLLWKQVNYLDLVKQGIVKDLRR